MNKVSFNLKNEKYVGFTAVGHTGYAEHGKDIVCAAVSVLTQSTANALEYFIGLNNLQVEVKDGELKVSVAASLDENAQHDAQVLMHSLYLGLTNLEDTYPQHIKIGKQEVDSDAKN